MKVIKILVSLQFLSFQMHELYYSKFIEKLPKGKHSTKGVGGTEPDPTGYRTIDGIEVPAGKGIKNSSVEQTSLLYNEYPFLRIFYLLQIYLFFIYLLITVGTV